MELSDVSVVLTCPEPSYGIPVSLWRCLVAILRRCSSISVVQMDLLSFLSRVSAHSKHLTDFSELSTHRYHPSKPFQPIGPSRASLAVGKGPPKKKLFFFFDE